MTDLLQLVSVIGLFVAIAIILVLTIAKDSQDTRAKKAGLKVSDERTRRVWGQAGYYAWVVSVVFTMCLFFVLWVGSYFAWFPVVSAMYALEACFLVSMVSFLLLHWYLDRKESFQ